jgi:AcrR family transcriptional regulator
MKMPSTPKNNLSRRKPQQSRAAARRSKFLDVAAHLIEELGYEAATMTAIAEIAGASVGTLYDYFPDKEAVASSLLAQYTEESDAHWEATLAATRLRPKADLATIFVEGMLAFVRERPAYLSLLDAPVAYSRSTAARQPLRRTFAHALEIVNPKIKPKHAVLSAKVVVEIIKAFLAVYKRTATKEKGPIAEEFKKLMRLYLSEVLG